MMEGEGERRVVSVGSGMWRGQTTGGGGGGHSYTNNNHSGYERGGGDGIVKQVELLHKHYSSPPPLQGMFPHTIDEPTGNEKSDVNKSQTQASLKKTIAYGSADFPMQKQIELNPSMVGLAYPYMDPYLGNIFATYGGQAVLNSYMLGFQQARMPLQIETDDEPVYVNAKQYRGILRRRQIRAKADLENKSMKGRKPYLHESRHLHAMRRARGSGGRFLNTKKGESCKNDDNNEKGAEWSETPGRSSIEQSGNLNQNILQEARSNTSGMCSSEVTSMSQSYAEEESYLFSQNDEPYYSNNLQGHFHSSVFHLTSRANEGESREGGVLVVNGSHQPRAVVLL